MIRRALSLLLFVSALAGPAAGQDRAALQAQFGDWLEQAIWPQAKAGGVTRATFERAFDGVAPDWDLPGLVMPGSSPAQAPARQAEFGVPEAYFKTGRLEGLAAVGRRMAARHADTLAAVEARTGVPGRIVLAIWGRESGFGNVAITHNAFQVLGTRAFADGGDYMARELVSLLKIAEAGHVPVEAMKSSWAGALGQPQMMPASFLAYAADGDGDGHADIWRSEADTIASIANFLQVHGWQPGRDWGYEVTVPEGVSCTLEGPDRKRPISEWVALGVTRVSGRPFPAQELDAEGSLLMPAGRYGPAFIVTPNFYVLKRYNRSDLYALFIGNAADRIAYGAGGFSGPWDDMGLLYRHDIAAIQAALESRGYDTGGADGLPGYKTRRAVGEWQETEAQTATCFPDAEMVGELGR